MTREEQLAIEAKRYYPDDINCYDAFLHGVKWERKHRANVWHSASEEPTAHNWEILCEDDFEMCWVVNHFDVARNWSCFCKDTSLMRWAYISDLLPKGGEK